MTTPAKHSTRYWIVATIIIIASTALGFFLGLFAELLYEQQGTFIGAGWKSGLVLGPVVAILYLIIVKAKRNCPIFSAHFMLYATLAGTAAGTAAATAMHIILMISYNRFHLFALAIGIAFGLAAGSILGIVAAALLKKEYSTEILPTAPTEEENPEKTPN